MLKYYYQYNQNNSGGTFRGPHHVVVEATSAAHADSLAELNGVYFDGVDSGRDCCCCGDRWSRAWEKGNETPQVYGQSLVTYKPSYNETEEVLFVRVDSTAVLWSCGYGPYTSKVGRAEHDRILNEISLLTKYAESARL